MVATDPSEDAELPTTRLQMTSVPCLGLILRCLSFFLHVHSLLWIMFPFTSDHCPYTPIWLHLWCGRSPLCSSRLFLIVLWCIINLLFSWYHTPFVLAYSPFTWSRVLLIDHSHPPSCLCSSFGPDLSGKFRLLLIFAEHSFKFRFIPLQFSLHKSQLTFISLPFPSPYDLMNHSRQGKQDDIGN